MLKKNEHYGGSIKLRNNDQGESHIVVPSDLRAFFSEHYSRSIISQTTM
ncbi:hypothetical protein VCHA51O444_10159 [Vibrio chagasii]|nr:hypothetical protein VCHA51O444_10159 [Vibrio chagasii]